MKSGSKSSRQGTLGSLHHERPDGGGVSEKKGQGLLGDFPLGSLRKQKGFRGTMGEEPSLFKKKMPKGIGAPRLTSPTCYVEKNVLRRILGVKSFNETRG